MVEQTNEFRAYSSGAIADPNANTLLIHAIKEAANRQVRSAEAHLKLDMVLAPEAEKMRVPGDFENIVGVFAALFQNSIVHSAQKDLMIKVECFYDQSTKKLICDVKDNGVGLPSKMRERLFEPFFTTSPRGTGLGLAIVKRVMEACGGVIREIGVAGQGATFRLEFPVFETK